MRCTPTHTVHCPHSLRSEAHGGCTDLNLSALSNPRLTLALCTLQVHATRPDPNPNPNPAHRCANATQRAAMLAVVGHARYARTEGLYYMGWCYCTRI